MSDNASIKPEPEQVKLPRGRPTKYTHDLAARIVVEVEQGVSSANAAASVGLHEATFNNWMKWGRGGEEPYDRFYQAIKAARRAACQLAEKVVYRAMQTDPHLAFKYLAIHQPKKYGARARLDLGAPGIPTTIQIKLVSEDDDK
jgi:hypothetical protein